MLINHNPKLRPSFQTRFAGSDKEEEKSKPTRTTTSLDQASSTDIAIQRSPSTRGRELGKDQPAPRLSSADQFFRVSKEEGEKFEGPGLENQIRFNELSMELARQKGHITGSVYLGDDTSRPDVLEHLTKLVNKAELKGRDLLLRLTMVRDNRGQPYGGTGRHTVGVHYNMVEQPVVTFLDSRGEKPSKSVENLLTSHVPGAVFEHNPTIQQTDEDIKKGSFDCGFWTSENLHHMSENPYKPRRTASDLPEIKRRARSLVRKTLKG